MERREPFLKPTFFFSHLEKPRFQFSIDSTKGWNSFWMCIHSFVYFRFFLDMIWWWYCRDVGDGWVGWVIAHPALASYLLMSLITILILSESFIKDLKKMYEHENKNTYSKYISTHCYQVSHSVSTYLILMHCQGNESLIWIWQGNWQNSL